MNNFKVFILTMSLVVIPLFGLLAVINENFKLQNKLEQLELNRYK
jgi:hypothetical protein